MSFEKGEFDRPDFDPSKFDADSLLPADSDDIRRIDTAINTAFDLPQTQEKFVAELRFSVSALDIYINAEQNSGYIEDFESPHELNVMIGNKPSGLEDDDEKRIDLSAGSDGKLSLSMNDELIEGEVAEEANVHMLDFVRNMIELEYNPAYRPDEIESKMLARNYIFTLNLLLSDTQESIKMLNEAYQSNPARKVLLAALPEIFINSLQMINGCHFRNAKFVDYKIGDQTNVTVTSAQSFIKSKRGYIKKPDDKRVEVAFEPAEVWDGDKMVKVSRSKSLVLLHGQAGAKVITATTPAYLVGPKSREESIEYSKGEGRKNSDLRQKTTKTAVKGDIAYFLKVLPAADTM